MSIKKYTNGSWTPACRKYGTETDTIATFPATIIGDGAPITSYTVKGNMEQSGTPTPSSPIYPSECGERTENLFDKGAITDGYAIAQDGTIAQNGNFGYTDYIQVTSGKSYTLSNLMTELNSWTLRVHGYNGENWVEQIFDRVISLTTTQSITFTIPSGVNALRLSLGIIDKRQDINILMLTSGSTAPTSYIPYGYKLPLTLGSTTTNIYLDEVQSTRRIKKLVLTGEEIINSMVDANDGAKAVSYMYSALGMTDIINNEIAMDAIPYPIYLSSHFKEKTSGYSSWFNINAGEIGANNELPYATNRYLIFGTSEQTQANFKSYLQQQYANGTPVTVWYVLNEPETAVVNEPIRKIGDYVDSISGTNLATTGTLQAFDVDTTLKPSEVDMTYHGWHEHGDTKFTT